MSDNEPWQPLKGVVALARTAYSTSRTGRPVRPSQVAKLLDRFAVDDR